MQADLDQLWMQLLYIYTSFILMTKGHILRMLAIYEIPGYVLKNHMELLYLLEVPVNWPWTFRPSEEKDHIHRHNSLYHQAFSWLCRSKWFPHHSTKHHSMGITALNYILDPEITWQLTNTGRDNMGAWVLFCIISGKHVVVTNAKDA